MFQKFYPDQTSRSSYEINYRNLWESGSRGLIFDIDNTLVPHGAPSDEACEELIRQLKEIGFQIVLLSNNKQERVHKFNEKLDVLTIFKANKPSVKNYLKAVSMMNLSKEEVVFIGDQVFTDIWGAKKAGIKNILVSPIHPKEEIQIVLKRIIEKPILAEYRKMNKKQEA